MLNLENPDLDDVEPEPLDLRVPVESLSKTITYFILLPIVFPLWLSLPDTRKRSCKYSTFSHRPLITGRSRGGGGESTSRSILAGYMERKNYIRPVFTNNHSTLVNLTRY